MGTESPVRGAGSVKTTDQRPDSRFTLKTSRAVIQQFRHKMCALVFNEVGFTPARIVQDIVKYPDGHTIPHTCPSLSSTNTDRVKCSVHQSQKTKTCSTLRNNEDQPVARFISIDKTNIATTHRSNQSVLPNHVPPPPAKLKFSVQSQTHENPVDF